MFALAWVALGVTIHPATSSDLQRQLQIFGKGVFFFLLMHFSQVWTSFLDSRSRNFQILAGTINGRTVYRRCPACQDTSMLSLLCTGVGASQGCLMEKQPVQIQKNTIWTTHVNHATAPVLLFSKLNKIFVGCVDRKHSFLGNEDI